MNGELDKETRDTIKICECVLIFFKCLIHPREDYIIHKTPKISRYICKYVINKIVGVHINKYTSYPDESFIKVKQILTKLSKDNFSHKIIISEKSMNYIIDTVNYLKHSDPKMLSSDKLEYVANICFLIVDWLDLEFITKIEITSSLNIYNSLMDNKTSTELETSEYEKLESILKTRYDIIVKF